MSTSLVPAGGRDVQVTTHQDLDRAKHYLAAEKASSTRRAYDADFRHFADWCGRLDEDPLPASTSCTARYLSELADAGLRVSTIVRRAASISYAHRARGLEPPTNAEPIKRLIKGIRRSLGTAPSRKSPITASELGDLLAQVPSDTLLGHRDRALLIIGFAGAMRRSELVALDVADIERVHQGILVTIRRSKTDQEGQGQTIAIPTGSKIRPVKALDAWLTAAGITEGAIFRPISRGDNVLPGRLTDGSVARIVKRYAGAAGLDLELFSGHSLRAGFVTEALDKGADVLSVMRVTRHVDPKTLAAYDRRSLFRGHAGKGIL